jgi:hypothetical protein
MLKRFVSFDFEGNCLPFDFEGTYPSILNDVGLPRASLLADFGFPGRGGSMLIDVGPPRAVDGRFWFSPGIDRAYGCIPFGWMILVDVWPSPGRHRHLLGNGIRVSRETRGGSRETHV